MSFGKTSMHDLYCKFTKLESKGNSVTLDMEMWRWVYVHDTFPRA